MKKQHSSKKNKSSEQDNKSFIKDFVKYLARDALIDFIKSFFDE